MSDFEKKIHTMFDHIWDCEIDHPVFQDTVGELMTAVIKCYELVTSAQPKRGKWIPWKYHNGFRCEYCNEPVDNKHNFCPNCGADMRGEKR